MSENIETIVDTNKKTLKELVVEVSTKVDYINKRMDNLETVKEVQHSNTVEIEKLKVSDKFKEKILWLFCTGFVTLTITIIAYLLTRK